MLRLILFFTIFLLTFHRSDCMMQRIQELMSCCLPARAQDVETPSRADLDLFYAMGRNHQKGALDLIASGQVNIHARHTNGHSFLYSSTQYTDPIIIDALIKAGANIHEKVWPNKRSLLHIQQNPQIASRLIGAGLDVNIVDLYNITPLHLAAEHENYKMMKFLLDNGANPYIKDKQGRMPGELAGTARCRDFIDNYGNMKLFKRSDAGKKLTIDQHNVIQAYLGLPILRPKKQLKR